MAPAPVETAMRPCWLALLALLLAPAGAAAGSGALELHGRLRQGGLLTGRVSPGTRVYFDGHPVRVGPRGWFALGLGRDAPRRAPLSVRGPQGAFRQRVLEVEQRHYRVQRINGLSPSLVHPDHEALRRIRREHQRVHEARGHFSPQSAFRRPFVWPVTGPITGVYGTRRVLNGEPRQPHYGVDIAAPAGTTVRAPAAGIVRMADGDLYFSGGTLILDHGHGVSSTFLHLRRTLVTPGERVEQGQPIAEVGATGRVTGAHLDWRMNWFDRRLDPALLVGPMPAANGSESARGG
ncbi:MAG TPA: M23 family metallopeptidase [Gammaproteobacteria bacterium]|nr:M23 family metallopeptidase [Gammaproteobacteria bacterium]